MAAIKLDYSQVGQYRAKVYFEVIHPLKSFFPKGRAIYTYSSKGDIPTRDGILAEFWRENDELKKSDVKILDVTISIIEGHAHLINR